MAGKPASLLKPKLAVLLQQLKKRCTSGEGAGAGAAGPASLFMSPGPKGSKGHHTAAATAAAGAAGGLQSPSASILASPTASASNLNTSTAQKALRYGGASGTAAGGSSSSVFYAPTYAAAVVHSSSSGAAAVPPSGNRGRSMTFASPGPAGGMPTTAMTPGPTTAGVLFSPPSHAAATPQHSDGASLLSRAVHMLTGKKAEPTAVASCGFCINSQRAAAELNSEIQSYKAVSGGGIEWREERGRGRKEGEESEQGHPSPPFVVICFLLHPLPASLSPAASGPDQHQP